MNNFYKFIPGEIKGEKIDKNIFAYNIKIGKFIFYMLGIILSFCLIHVVFSKTINELTLENTISLGAVFATLGSAIVASASLYCNDCYTKFSDNVNTLQNDFLKDESWTRWTFIKRKSKHRLLDSGNLLWKLENAMIEFQLGSHSIQIYIPTVRADFDDLPIFKHFLLMKRYDKQHETFLYNHANDASENTSYFLWDCIFDIYRNIILYKIGSYFIWIGSSFIGISTIYSLAYIQIKYIIACLCK